MTDRKAQSIKKYLARLRKELTVLTDESREWTNSFGNGVNPGEALHAVKHVERDILEIMSDNPKGRK